jgi:hypothetical protein
VVDYVACSLEERGYARLLERLFTEARISRPARVALQGGFEKWGVEARTASLDGRRLLYVVNYNAAPARLKVEAAGVTGLRDLRAEKTVRGTEIDVAGRQTEIYELH